MYPLSRLLVFSQAYVTVDDKTFSVSLRQIESVPKNYDHRDPGKNHSAGTISKLTTHVPLRSLGTIFSLFLAATTLYKHNLTLLHVI